MLMMLAVWPVLGQKGAADAHDAGCLAGSWSDTVQLMLMMLALWPVLGHGAADAHDAGGLANFLVRHCAADAHDAGGLAGSWSDRVQLMLMMLALWPVLGQTRCS